MHNFKATISFEKMQPDLSYYGAWKKANGAQGAQGWWAYFKKDVLIKGHAQ